MPVDRPRADLVQRFAERLKQNGGAISSLGQLAEADVAVPVYPPKDAPCERGVHPAAPAVLEAVKPAGPIAEPHIKIDVRRLQRLGYTVPDPVNKSLLSEELRLIKRPLIQKAFARGKDAIRNGNVILVTSSRPGEGKTFTAVNLALSMASERDLHVMLVDSDSYTQAVLGAFGASAEKGLVDVLLNDQADLADVILRTNIPNFTIVPAGPRHPNGPELLSSHRMARLTEAMASRYPDRIVIIDSSPVLASTEPSMLAAHVGQVIMVIEQNRTPWAHVDRALSLLEGCTDISFVLNKVDKKLWEEDYASHYNSRTNETTQ
jgi:receptor protein-tyrosine kinase